MVIGCPSSPTPTGTGSQRLAVAESACGQGERWTDGQGVSSGDHDLSTGGVVRNAVDSDLSDSESGSDHLCSVLDVGNTAPARDTRLEPLPSRNVLHSADGRHPILEGEDSCGTDGPGPLSAEAGMAKETSDPPADRRHR